MVKTKYTQDILKEAVAQSVSYSEVVRRVGIKTASGESYRYIKELISNYEIDTSHFLGIAWARSKERSKFSADKVLVILTGHRRGRPYQLRRAMVESGISLICNQCKIEPTWNGLPLTMEVDHIDGNWRDCRLQNLQFLCPNCHSQKHSQQYSQKRKAKVCPCGRSIKKTSTQCRLCAVKTKPHPTKIIWPDETVLAELVWNKSLSQIAKTLGVSDAAVKKRCKKFGIKTPPIGYWAKFYGDMTQHGEGNRL